MESQTGNSSTTPDGKIFKVGTEVASVSSVWKDMLQTGDDTNGNQVISLAEDEPILLQFLLVLKTFGKEKVYPETLCNLDLNCLSRLLEMGDKYDTLMVGLFVERAVMIQVLKGDFYLQDYAAGDILRLFFYSEKLELEELIHISAKLSFQIKNLVTETPDEMEFITRKEHLAPLVKFR